MKKQMDNLLPPIDDSLTEEIKPVEEDKKEVEPLYVPYLLNSEQPQVPKKDIFGDIDKVHIVIAFVIFLIGFFMGKTMQPVIIRHH